MSLESSENPINGKTSHKGRVAHVVVMQLPTFTANRQKHAHTGSKKSLNALQPCPQPCIKACQLGSIGALLFVLPNVQCKWQRQRGQLSLVLGETQQRWC